MQGATRITDRTALINKAIFESDIAATIGREGRQTPQTSTREQIAQLERAAAARSVESTKVAVDAIGQAKTVMEKAISGKSITPEERHILSLAQQERSRLVVRQQTFIVQKSLALPDSPELEQLNTQIAQIETILAPIANSTDAQITDALKADAIKRIKSSLTKSGIQNINQLSVAGLNIAAAAMVTYENAVSRQVGLMGTNAQSDQAKATILDQTKGEKETLIKALDQILLASGVIFKNKALQNAQSDLRIAMEANIGQIVTFSDGALDKVRDVEHKKALVEEMSQAITAPLIASLEEAPLQKVLAYQQTRLQQATNATQPSRALVFGQFIAKNWQAFRQAFIPTILKPQDLVKFVPSRAQVPKIPIDQPVPQGAIVSPTSNTLAAPAVLLAALVKAEQSLNIAVLARASAMKNESVTGTGYQALSIVNITDGLKTGDVVRYVASDGNTYNLRIDNPADFAYAFRANSTDVFFSLGADSSTLKYDPSNGAVLLFPQGLSIRNGSTEQAFIQRNRNVINLSTATIYRPNVATVIAPQKLQELEQRAAAMEQAKLSFNTIHTALEAHIQQQLTQALGITNPTPDVTAVLGLAAANITVTLLEQMEGGVISNAYDQTTTGSVQKLLIAIANLSDPNQTITNVIGSILADARNVTPEQIAQVITGQVAQSQPQIPASLTLSQRWDMVKHWLISPNPFAVFNRSLPLSERAGQLAVWTTLRVAVPFGIGLVNPLAAGYYVTATWGWDIARFVTWPVRAPVVALANALMRTPLARDFILGERIITVLNDTNPSIWRGLWKSVLMRPTVINILAGSREGFWEHYYNARFLALGDTNTSLGNRFWQTVTSVTRFFTAPHMLGMRMVQSAVMRANSTPTVPYRSPLSDLPITEPNEWSLDGYLYSFIPRSILNATPRNNTVVWALTRVGLFLTPFPLSTISHSLWAYDVHRFLSDGYKTPNFLNASQGRLRFLYWDLHWPESPLKYFARVRSYKLADHVTSSIVAQQVAPIPVAPVTVPVTSVDLAIYELMGVISGNQTVYFGLTVSGEIVFANNQTGITTQYAHVNLKM